MLDFDDVFRPIECTNCERSSFGRIMALVQSDEAGVPGILNGSAILIAMGPEQEVCRDKVEYAYSTRCAWYSY